MEDRNFSLKQCLATLFFARFAALIITAVNAVTTLDSITKWLIKGIAVVVIWSLFRMKDVNPRYRKSAVAKIIVLICGLLPAAVNTAGLGASSIVALVGSAASWIAAYQEYHGHGEWIAEKDPVIAGKWNGLFPKEILLSLGISMISVVGTTVMVAAGTVSGTITTVIIGLTVLCSIVLDGLYLHYMKQTLKLLEA